MQYINSRYYKEKSVKLHPCNKLDGCIMLQLKIVEILESIVFIYNDMLSRYDTMASENMVDMLVMIRPESRQITCKKGTEKSFPNGTRILSKTRNCNQNGRRYNYTYKILLLSTSILLP